MSPEELLHELPPLGNIQKKIDSIPSSKLPNLSHHRMSPKEHEALQQIVDDLLAKNHIQECINPCVVPALLIPKKDEIYRMYEW